MKKIDYKISSIAIMLIVIAIVSYTNWETVSKIILTILESRELTFIIWSFLITIGIIHYVKNHSENKNLISDKEGLEKPIDYFQYILTYGSIGTSIQILSKEVFLKYNFPEKQVCMYLNNFDYSTFVIVIFVLLFYSYGKIKPVIQETFVNKEKIRLDD